MKLFPLRSRGGRALLWAALVCVVGVLCLLRWGGYWLVAEDPLPPNVDAAVTMQGSMLGTGVRVDGAIALLQSGRASHVLLSIPGNTLWGEPVPGLVRRYVEATYPKDIAANISLCETPPEVNSTEQEANVLIDCIRAEGWSSVAIVTSDYHTRRAGMIWRRTVKKKDPSLRISMHGVADPEYEARGWWRQRVWAKTWLLEVTKLIWASGGG